jgi:hypothetical protein
MTVPARLVHNSHCDRCGVFDPVPRGYGFADGKNGVKFNGYNLCKECANQWENFIRSKIKEWGRKDWHEYANKLLVQFVENMLKEKVQFN